MFSYLLSIFNGFPITLCSQALYITQPQCNETKILNPKSEQLVMLNDPTSEMLLMIKSSLILPAAATAVALLFLPFSFVVGAVGCCCCCDSNMDANTCKFRV